MRRASRRGLWAVLVAPFLLAYIGSISARADLGVMSVATSLASVSGAAQCDGTLLPAATVQLFNGEDLVATTTADATAQFAFPAAAVGVYTVRVASGSTVCGYQVTLKPASTNGWPTGPNDPTLSPLAVKTAAGCPRDTKNNHAWTTAALLDALSATPAPATVDECLYRQDQSAWFKVPIQPGSKVIVSLTNLPANYDLTLYKDIAAAAIQSPASTPSSLARVSAEFAPDAASSDAYAPDAYSPDAYSPDAYSPDAYSPDAYSPDAYSPDAYSPDAYSPDAYSPDAYSPDAYSGNAYSPDSYSPDNQVQNAQTTSAVAGSTPVPAAYASAQTRSPIGVSAQ